MIDNLLSIVAPHHCSGCDKVGTLLCNDCKYNISSEPFSACLVCQKPSGAKGICSTCRVPYSRAWVVGERRDALQRLIGLYKFERTKSAYRDIGDLLLDILPDLPRQTIIVPVPTLPSHIRERGYDHIRLIADYVAKRRNLAVSYCLKRVTTTTQRHATVTKRELQAKKAFTVTEILDPQKTYLLIDDIYTTGATLKYASKELLKAGASTVWVAVVARQTLD